ncbi:MAG: HlyD family efflux transporter periplasmic adaptor subunit [Woeseiaceae bacterium]
MKIHFRAAFWSAAVIVVVALLVLAFLPKPVEVDVAEATRGSLRVTVQDEGRTRVRDEYIVSAPVAGHLLRVDYKPGATVRAGETVARILPGKPAFLDSRSLAEAQARVRSAEAALAAARAELEQTEERLSFARAEEERTTSLRNKGLASAGEYDRAQLELRTAQAGRNAAAENVALRGAELDAAVARLLQPGGKSDTNAVVEIVAPVAGRVLRVTQESESVIAAGAGILSIGDPENLEVVVELLSTDAVQVGMGAEVIMEGWGRSDELLAGRVRMVEPYGFLKVSALGVEEQRVNVIVDFTGPPSDWSTLGHGYRVEAAIVTWEAEDVLRIPVAALFRRGGEWAVFRVHDGNARLTAVRIGRDNGRFAEVLSGLQAGDKIILYPGEQVGDGVSVTERVAALK